MKRGPKGVVGVQGGWVSSCPSRNRKNLAPTLRNVYAPTLESRNPSPHPPFDPFSSRPTTHGDAGKEMQLHHPLYTASFFGPQIITSSLAIAIIIIIMMVIVILLATHKSRSQVGGGWVAEGQLLAARAGAPGTAATVDAATPLFAPASAAM